jgi:hypothetical protein
MKKLFLSTKRISPVSLEAKKTKKKLKENFASQTRIACS